MVELFREGYCSNQEPADSFQRHHPGIRMSCQLACRAENKLRETSFYYKYGYLTLPMPHERTGA